MLRIRDNFKATMEAYEILFQGSMVFGVRKQIKSEAGMDSLENKNKELKKRLIQLKNQVNFEA